MTLTKMWVPICLYCSNCTKFGQLILRKIIKIVATRCQILWLKCTKFDFGWGFGQIRFRLGLCPSPSWGSLQRSPDPLAGLGGLLLRGREGRGRGEGREGEGLKPPQSKFSGYVAGATEDKEEWRHREMSKTCCTAEDYWTEPWHSRKLGAPCRLRDCKNRPALFHGRMS